MAINISGLDNIENKKSGSNCWCNFKDCIYNQNGYCYTGPELEYTGKINNKGKPYMVCVAAYKK